MTTPGSTPPKSSFREYVILVLVILAGIPVAWYWGIHDGKALAEKAYGGTGAAADDDYDYEDEEADGAAAGSAGEIPAATEVSIARGKELFQVHCVACHGADADGKGPAAVAFTPPPRDFTNPSEKWTLGRAPEQIHAAVSKGVPGTGMAGFAAAMSAEELWSVVHYISSLPGVAGAR